MGFLIDTGLWIALERGRIGAGDIHAITAQNPIYLSPVNLAEIRYGIELMTVPTTKQKATATLRRMRRKPLLRITGETAEVFGTLAAELRRNGRGGGFSGSGSLACRPSNPAQLHLADRQSEGLSGYSRSQVACRPHSMMI